MKTLTTALSTLFVVLALPMAAHAQDDQGEDGTANGECTGSSDDPACGAPDQSGGGGCGCGGGSILINFTDQGDSYQYADDYDDDAWEDNFDNCPFAANADQVDSDGDGYGDACDNCPNIGNENQFDVNGNGQGDACDPDADGDGIPNIEDNCLGVANPSQMNTNGNQLGDACDDDDDGDGCPDITDNCPLAAPAPGASCQDTGEIVSDECFPDEDGDDVPDYLDNCPGTPNPGQEASFGQDMGDVCNPDRDSDGLANQLDNCPDVPNELQVDADNDLRGDACDQRFCYVVSNEDTCLDPSAPFAVHAGKSEVIQVGDAVPLRLFANRDMKAIRYTWSIYESPADGRANLENPKGAVSFSQDFLYFYDRTEDQDFTAYFRPEAPGTYVVKLQGELAYDDDLYPGQTVAESFVEFTVEGDALPACSHTAAPNSNAPWALAALGLLGMALLRRRRS
jgi:MYXO-CTERM domain-containing protein